MHAIQIEPDPCRCCGGRGSVWHRFTPHRVAVVECWRCGTTGPDVPFADGTDEAEFVAVARWNRLMYGG